MHALPSRRSRRLLSGLVAAMAALVSTGLGAAGAAAANDDVTAYEFLGLYMATGNCTGTSADPTRITLAADIDEMRTPIEVVCHAVLDLAGHDLAVPNALIHHFQALTVEDTGGGGTLTVGRHPTDSTAGIQNTLATLTIDGGTVTATGGMGAAGIGGNDRADGGTTLIHGGTVLAQGGWGGAGIGGGHSGWGGHTVIDGGTVFAEGGEGGAGIGGGHSGNGGDTVIDGGTVIAIGSQQGDPSAVGPGASGSSFGSLSVTGGVLRLPANALRVPDSAQGAEITLGPDGVIAGSGGPGSSYATVTGDGQVDNGGRILMPAALVTGNGVTVRGRHYEVGFDTQGGSSAPGPVTLFADTFNRGARSLPPDPTKPGLVFTGWNTAADGTGDPIKRAGVLPGSSSDGTPAQITAYAQWHETPVITAVAPSNGPMAGGTEVVITGTGFTDAGEVIFGVTGDAAGFTVDSDTQITAISPVSATHVTRHIRVTTAAGTSPAVSADLFTYTAPPPEIAGILPSSGPLEGGTEVVISGTGFTDATRVGFGLAGPAAGFTVDSDTQITAISPASATSVTRHIRVTTRDGTGPALTSPVVAVDRYTWR